MGVAANAALPIVNANERLTLRAEGLGGELGWISDAPLALKPATGWASQSLVLLPHALGSGGGAKSGGGGGSGRRSQDGVLAAGVAGAASPATRTDDARRPADHTTQT